MWESSCSAPRSWRPICTTGAIRASVSRPRRCGHATWKRSSRRRARFSPSVRSTSRPTPPDASPVSRSKKASASRPDSSCSRSIRSSSKDRCSAEKPASPPRNRRLLSARTAVEQGRANLDLARQNLKRQEDLWKEGLTTRENLERAQNDVTVREIRSQGAAAGHRNERGANPAGTGRPVDDSLQPESDHHHRSDGRPGDTAQHRGGRNGRSRDDEQRRVGAADHRGHVGDRSRSGSRRNRDSNCGAQSGGQGHDRRRARSHVSRPRHRDREQPDPDEHAEHGPADRRPRSRW